MDMFRGVAYLHAGKPPIVHQDIKSYVFVPCFNKVNYNFIGTTFLLMVNIMQLSEILVLLWNCHNLYLEERLSQHPLLLEQRDISHLK